MIGEIVTIIVLTGVILYQGWLFHDQRKAYEQEIGDLLNRLMARDYPMYVQGEVAKEQVKRPLTPEEIYEMQQERGIPV